MRATCRVRNTQTEQPQAAGLRAPLQPKPAKGDSSQDGGGHSGLEGGEPAWNRKGLCAN